MLWRGIDHQPQIRTKKTHVALRPMGLTLIIPLRNSTNVPLQRTLSESTQHRSSAQVPFDWDVHICNVVQNKVDQGFIPHFANVFDKRLWCQGSAHFKCSQSILCEGIIEILDDYRDTLCQLQFARFRKTHYCFRRLPAAQLSWLDLTRQQNLWLLSFVVREEAQ